MSMAAAVVFQISTNSSPAPPEPRVRSSLMTTVVPVQTAAPGTHAPAVQTSPEVHTLPSLHEPPLATGFVSHAPLFALHDPTLQASDHGHAFAVPLHAPARHESLTVQGLPSSQGVRLGFSFSGVHMPVAGVQVPAVWH
jgi:hypothetical protein